MPQGAPLDHIILLAKTEFQGNTLDHIVQLAKTEFQGAPLDFELADEPFAPTTALSPPYDEPVQSAPTSALSPPYDEEVDALPSPIPIVEGLRRPHRPWRERRFALLGPIKGQPL